MKKRRSAHAQPTKSIELFVRRARRGELEGGGGGEVESSSHTASREKGKQEIREEGIAKSTVDSLRSRICQARARLSSAF